MATKVIVRCKKCSKVFQGKSEEDQIYGVCPSCGDKLVIYTNDPQVSRKNTRAVVSESKFVKPIPANLTKSKQSPFYRVIYTEVPPVEFVSKHLTYVPLLDLSEGGMGLLVRSDQVSSKLLPGDVFIVEIDFPILVQSIFIQVEVCWIRPISEDTLLHIGVRFCKSDESFKDLLKNLMNYIKSRAEASDHERTRYNHV